MPLEIQPERPPIVADLPRIPPHLVNKKNGMVKVQDIKTGVAKWVYGVDAREMLACGAVRLIEPDQPPSSRPGTAEAAAPEVPQPASGAIGPDPIAGLDEMSVAELRDVAKDAGVSGFSTMKKDELIAAIREPMT